MQLTPEQERLGKDNFHEAVAFTRRDFLVGAAAAVPTLGAAYFGYGALKGDPVKVGFIGTGDEGSVLLTQHPPQYMDIVAIADLRAKNRVRALQGDGNEVRWGLIRKLGAEKAQKVNLYRDHLELLKKHPEIEAVVIAVPLCQHARVAIDCLKAGKHVLTEKLMAHTVTQCKEMIRVAKQENKLLAVGHQRHYNVLYDNANALIQSGMLGDIKFIRAQWHRNNSFPGSDSWRPGGYTKESFERKFKQDIEGLTDFAKERGIENLDEFLSKEFGYPSMDRLVNWRLYYNTGGGLMAELGSHQLDAASIFLNKVQPIACFGYGGKNFYGVKGIGSADQQADDRDVDDHVYMTFEFPGKNYAQDKNDVCIVTYSSISTNRSEPYGETVFGSRGTLIMKEELQAILSKEPTGTSKGGIDQRLYAIEGSDGQPVLAASASLGPTKAAAIADVGIVSRGYTEEMEHFAFCVRNYDKNPSEAPLRCPGKQGMKDAIMALTSNLAMKSKKRILFKDEWFDPDSDAAPETDKEIIG
jgi:predicted dehydrogenase